MKIMKIGLVTLGILAAVVALVALIGTLLPVNHTARTKTTINAPPEEVWGALTNVAEFPKWRSDVTTVEILPSQKGWTAWREDGSNGKISYAQAEAVRPSRLRVRLTDESLPFGGSWTYELSPVPGGTELNITEDGEVRNPIFRFVSRFVFGHHKTQETFLRDLGKHFHHDVTPERI